MCREGEGCGEVAAHSGVKHPAGATRSIGPGPQDPWAFPLDPGASVWAVKMPGPIPDCAPWDVPRTSQSPAISMPNTVSSAPKKNVGRYCTTAGVGVRQGGGGAGGWAVKVCVMMGAVEKGDDGAGMPPSARQTGSSVPAPAGRRLAKHMHNAGRQLGGSCWAPEMGSRKMAASTTKMMMPCR